MGMSIQSGRKRQAVCPLSVSNLHLFGRGLFPAGVAITSVCSLGPIQQLAVCQYPRTHHFHPPRGQTIVLNSIALDWQRESQAATDEWGAGTEMGAWVSGSYQGATARQVWMWSCRRSMQSRSKIGNPNHAPAWLAKSWCPLLQSFHKTEQKV